MLVELGNPRPILHNPSSDGSHGDHLDAGLNAPAVTYVNIPDLYTYDPSADVTNLMRHIIQNPDVTNLPNHEALLSIVHGAGLWAHHGFDVPSWVHSYTHPDFAAQLQEWYGVGPRPDDFEETHHTFSGAPGVGPWIPKVESLFTDDGRVMWARALGGGLLSVAGHSTTPPGATTYTLDDQTAPGSISFYTGQRIYATSGTNTPVWANVISNTNASPPVLTLDRWYTSATPGAGAGTTPAAGPYVLTDGFPPAWFVGLTTTNITPAHGDTSMSGEITANPSGLKRKIAPWALTSGVTPASYTLTPVYTVQGGDTGLPATVYAIGVFTSMVPTDATKTMMFETTLNASATLTTTGDQLTVTETVTGS